MNIHERSNNRAGETGLPAEIYITPFSCFNRFKLVLIFHVHYGINDSKAHQSKWSLNVVTDTGTDLEIPVLTLRFGSKLSQTKIAIVRFPISW